MFKALRRWMKGRRLDVPRHYPDGNHSSEELIKSQEKLKDAISDRREVRRAKAISDQFAVELERTMRRSHG